MPGKHIYSCKRDSSDHRDLIFKAASVQLPPKVDLEPFCPPVVDQGTIGSCTAQASAAHFDFLQLKELKSGGVEVYELGKFHPSSRQFLYYNFRVNEGTVKEDSGASLRDIIKVLTTVGSCREAIWPYSPSDLYTKPSPIAYAEASKHKISVYMRILPSVDAMKQALHSGYPFILGIAVYDSFESDYVARTGMVPMPQSNEQLLGGHEVLAVGYDDSIHSFKIRNSWGTNWGLEGYCWLSYSYLANPNLASDFWTFRK